jgi:hypothetical protein
MNREELIKELDVIWMMGPVHETKARVSDFILADRARLLAKVEECVKPLRNYNRPAMLPDGYLYNAHKVMAETLSALDKLKEGEEWKTTS